MAKQQSKPEWPRGVFEITEAEYTAARAEADGSDTRAAEAYQVVRYCRGFPFYGDMVKDWLCAVRSKTQPFQAKAS